MKVLGPFHTGFTVAFQEILICPPTSAFVRSMEKNASLINFYSFFADPNVMVAKYPKVDRHKYGKFMSDHPIDPTQVCFSLQFDSYETAS